MKKLLCLLLCLVMLMTLSPLSVSAATKTNYIHKKMSWKTLNAADTFLEPYKDYESVYDNTQDKYLFSEFEADLFALRDQFSDLMRLEVIGYSELGRPLYAVVMGSDSAPNRFLLIAGAHAREYIGTQLNVLQIESYLHNYYNTIDGERVCDLLERCQFYFIPLLNPDGAMLTMTGLDSLDEPGLTVTPEDKAEIEKFLLSQVDDLNWVAETSTHFHDTDAEFYSDNPDPERDDAFQYWKSNVRGVDVHYNMYNEWMMSAWKRGSWYYRSIDEYFTAPRWSNFAGVDEDDGVTTAENIALAAYTNKIQPNIFITYHAAGSIVQWDYGYASMAHGAELKENAQQIAFKCGSLTNYPVDTQDNASIGHTGWFMVNSQNYMDKGGFGVVIELAQRTYLEYVGDNKSYTDTPPIQASTQLTQDVKTNTGFQNHSIWTTCKYLPIGLSQFIMDNQLVETVTPLTGKASDAIRVTSILGNTVGDPTPSASDDKIMDYGTFQLPRASKSTVIPGDILTNDYTPSLYNSDFTEIQDSVAVNGTTQVYFSYTNSTGQTVKATFTVEPVMPITTAVGESLKLDTAKGNGLSRSTPARLLSGSESGIIALAEHHGALSAADFSAAAGYTVNLYSDETFSTQVENLALAEGESSVYVSISAEGDKGYYTLKLSNPEAPPEPVQEPAPAAGINPIVIGAGAAVVVLAVVIALLASKKRKKA